MGTFKDEILKRQESVDQDKLNKVKNIILDRSKTLKSGKKITLDAKLLDDDIIRELSKEGIIFRFISDERDGDFYYVSI